MNNTQVSGMRDFAEFGRKANRWLGKTLFNVDSLSAYVEPLFQSVSPMWSAGQSTARVLEVRRESSDIFTLRLAPSKAWKGFLPGQFVGLTVEKNGARLTRYFSLSSAPALWRESSIIELTIRQQQGGVVTNWMSEQLYAGIQVALTQAEGGFTLARKTFPALFIAGGSGITPFRSILQELSDSRTSTNVHLLYYCDGETHLFKSEWDKIQQQCPHIKVSLINALTLGRFGTAHLFEFVPDYHQRDIYICGPSPMIIAARDILKKEGVDNRRVHFEFFGAAPIAMAPREPGEATGRAVFQHSGLIVDASKENPSTLLEMAESVGLTPVTGCRMGVCHQCICQKSSGRVLNTLTGRTSDNGAGEVQLCVSVPVTDVMLDL